MGLDLEYGYGQTPLDEEEKEGLKILTITTRGELNEFEQQNIEQAVLWILKKNFKPEIIFSEAFVREVHKRMYNNVWTWAGDFRKTDKNIGIDKWQISTALKNLLDDAKYWYDNKTFSFDEIAIRFKHRIVSIHCFPNGNGRHSRLMADIIIEKIYESPVFSWGAASFSSEIEARKTYIKALKSADNGDYSLLLVFARA